MLSRGSLDLGSAPEVAGSACFRESAFEQRDVRLARADQAAPEGRYEAPPVRITLAKEIERRSVVSESSWVRAECERAAAGVRECGLRRGGEVASVESGQLAELERLRVVVRERLGVVFGSAEGADPLLFVEDKDRAKAFYQRVFELEPAYDDQHDVMFRLKNVLLFLTKSSAAPRMIAPAAVGDHGQGPRHVFAIIVADVDAVCSELMDKGIQLLNGPEDRPWGMRTANFQDPDGHVWEVATELPGEEA